MGPDINKVFDAIQEVSSKQDEKCSDKKTLLLQRTLKMTEEIGEFTAEVLKLDGFKSTTESPVVTRKKLQQEAIDVFIMSVDLLKASGVTKEFLQEYAEEQLLKWKTQHLK
jgi:NTP pyrophosphatase (non-canonical NTP hydrolase)